MDLIKGEVTQTGYWLHNKGVFVVDSGNGSDIDLAGGIWELGAFSFVS